jgi:tyrosyl-tRNA synthetase
MNLSQVMGQINSAGNQMGNRNINEFFNPRKSDLSLDERYELCASVGEEVIKLEELRELLERKELFKCYDGFEPSGRMHIAQGIMKSINVNKITKAGGIFIFWVADWFALLNNKMDGDLDKIRTVGRYFVEVWKAAGMDLANVQFLWASEEINKRAEEYWSLVIDISRKFNITRIKKCSQIMGRGEGDDMPTSNILYPCMQCADIFFLGADVCQLGLD